MSVEDDLTEKLIFYGGLAVLAYILYKKYVSPVVNVVSTGITAAQQAVSNASTAVQDILNPTPAGGSSTSYNVVMPNGTSQYVDSSQVNGAGQFTASDGNTYQLIVAAGGAAAVPADSILNAPAEAAGGASS